MNLGNSPRASGCWVCDHVTAIQDVTVRMFNDEGTRLRNRDAIEYLTSIGFNATLGVWSTRLQRHASHVLRQVAVTPAHRELQKVAPAAPVGGPPSWVRAPDRAIDLGMGAMGILAERMEDLKDQDLLQLARLGVSAASKVGDWHAKGRQMGQVDRLMDLFFEAGDAGEG